jgi:hypothetical protein
MREYDDDNIQHYAPVLRRIIILVAVITAVPVMLWTITAFMRTYIAQPTISAPRPLAAATDTAAPMSPAADTATANPPAAAIAPPQPGPAVTDARATDDAKSDRMGDSPGNAASSNVQVAAVQPAPSTAPAAAPAPAAVTVQAPPATAAPSVFPNPPFVAPQPTPAAPDSSDDAAADALPPPDPITGTVPLPRHRPSVLALVDTDIPLPRARPSDAPEPPAPTPEAPSSGYDPGIGHD